MGTQVPHGMVFKQLKHIISSETRYFGYARHSRTVYTAQPVVLLRPKTEGKKEVVIRCRDCQQEVKIEVKSQKELWRERLFIGLAALVLAAITYGLSRLNPPLSQGGLLTGLAALACIVGVFVADGVSMQVSASHSLGGVPRKMKKQFKNPLASGTMSKSSPQQNTNNKAAG